MLRHIYIFIFLVMTIIISSIGFSQSVAQIGASKDNTIYEDPNGAFSNGAGDFIFAGTNATGLIRRALLQFDIAGNVPASATIDSVRLTLYMSRTSLADSRPVELHRVLMDWGEDTSHAAGNEGGGDSAAVGDATWLHTFFDTQFWTNQGGDFASTVSATQAVGDTAYYSWGSTSQMVADVQDWLSNPANNFGWIILSNESANQTAKRFDSRENSITSRQPLLTVYYTPTTGIAGNNPNLTQELKLSQNYPNPFNPSTTIGFEIPSNQFVTLKIYDVLGAKVATLIDEEMSAGQHEVTFDAADFSAGIYFYELRAGDFEAMKSMVLIK